MGEAVKAIIVPNKKCDLTEEEILDLCKENLAAYKKPKSIEFVQELPKTGANKLAKKVLRDRYWEKEKIKVG